MRDAVAYLTLLALALFVLLNLFGGVQEWRGKLTPWSRTFLRDWQWVACWTAVGGTIVLVVWRYWP